jgi:ribose/xylose/arabinose/galactoside ABC-type transport system permease subunit
MRKRLDLSVVASLLLLVAILVFFIISTKGNMVTVFNIKAIVDQSVIFIIAGLGALFVVAQGGADLSIGTTLGIATVGGASVAVAGGSEWLVFPVAIAIALVQGFVNGFLVAKMKVPSFMVTLSFLIGMRGLILFVQSETFGFYRAAGPILVLKNSSVKYTLLVVLVVVFYFLLSHTKFGEYCKAIGENENVALSVGIPVAKMKILAFMLSALMAAVAGFFMMAKVGGTNNTMGMNLEIDALMGIFLGGVLVTGGYGTKISKLLIGAFTLSIIKNGMIILGKSSVQVTEATEGILLILILLVMLQLKKREGKLSARPEPEEAVLE